MPFTARPPVKYVVHNNFKVTFLRDEMRIFSYPTVKTCSFGCSKEP